MERFFGVIDPGGREIAAVAAKWNRSGDLSLEALCRSSSEGFRRGQVTNMADAVKSVSGVMGKLSDKVGSKIHDVYAGVSSTSMSLDLSNGVILLSKYGREVTSGDIERCVKLASIMKTPIDREILHRIVWGFSLDSEKDIKDPLNLEGVKLSADVNILTVNTSVLRNMEKCIAQAGYVAKDFISLGMTSVNRCFADEEMKGDSAHVFIGPEMSEIMVFFRGRLAGCKVLPVGTTDMIKEDGSIESLAAGKLVSSVATISGWERVNRVVVTGEGALQSELLEYLESCLSVPVKAGSCIARPFEDLPDDRAAYLGCMGILDHLQENSHKRKVSASPVRKTVNAVLGFVDRYF